jgi:hypothetical protein
MWNFEKIHRIKEGDKVLATSTIHKIRIPIDEFVKMAENAGFKGHRVKLGKYFVLSKQ